MSGGKKIPPSILDQCGNTDDLSDETKDRFGRLLRIAKQTAKELDEETSAAKIEAIAIARESRWAGHENVPTTPVRVASSIVERLKNEVPKSGRRAFVDNAILSALDCTTVKS